MSIVARSPRLSYRSEVSVRVSRTFSTNHAHSTHHKAAAQPAASAADSTSHPSSHSAPPGHTHTPHKTLRIDRGTKPPLVIPDLSEDDGVAAHMPTFDGEGRWDNPWPTWKAKTLMDIAKFLARGFKNKLPTKAALDRYYPMHTPDYAALHSPDPHLVQVTWVGHSTFLVQVDGLNFLTDPVWAEYASPVPFGPKRFRPPGLPIEKLPKIDFVLLSHNHYDHLDLSVVRTLGNSVKWYIPFGMKEWFYGENVTNVSELGWWEHALHNAQSDAAVFMLPAQHWSKRTMWDERQTLWGSFAVVTPRHRVYFAGDTGYCSVFSEIGRRFGPFDLSLLPIGAYEPKEFMGPAHVDPGGAVAIHQDIQSRKSIGMHYGTFRLTDELTHQPPRLLLEELEERGVPPADFFCVNHGETVKFRKEGERVALL